MMNLFHLFVAASRQSAASSKCTRAALLLVLALAGMTTIVRAQNAIVIPPGGFDEPGLKDPIKVNISGFTGEVNDVLNFDLYVMGFKNVPASEAQFLITGRNNSDVQGSVTDAVIKQVRLNQAYSGGNLRRQAHAFADDIAYTLSGSKGIAQTRIAFKVDTGRASEIYIADFDGHNRQQVTRDGSIVAAPAWVPGKMALCYTSYRLGNPDIYHHDLASGARSAVARFSGLNTSAAVSPDGSRVAMILSKDGSPDVYVAGTDGSGLRRLTRTTEDESSPCWSPDGQWICFASKQGGARGLFKVPSAGGSMQRISAANVSNPSEPDWSPDGKWIAFTAQMGSFQICVVPAAGGKATPLVEGEDPSWGLNSRTLIFVKRSGSSRSLSLLDVPTKQVKDAARISGSNSQPSWAK
jgi:TolB protein